MKIVSFILLVLVYACAPQKTHENVVEVKHPNVLFDSISVIPLETKNESLIGMIKKCIVTDSITYILDRQQDCILLFGNDGKYLRKLNSKGNGPGEFQNISDFIVDKSNGDLEVLTNYCIMKYNKYLEFVEEVELPKVSHFFAKIDDETYVLYHLHDKHRISVFSTSTNKIVKSTHFVPKYFRMLYNPYYSPFINIGEECLFKSTYSNDILCISSDNISKKYNYFPNVDLNLLKLPKDKSKDFYLSFISKTDLPFVISAAETKDIYQCTYYVNGRRLFNIKHKTSDLKYKFVKFNGISYVGNFSNSNFTYGAMEAVDAFSMINSKDFKELLKFKELPRRDKADILNPFLIKYFIKEIDYAK